MSRLEFHPLANIFPMMTDEEVNDLCDDMLKHGQREPIWKIAEAGSPAAAVKASRPDVKATVKAKADRAAVKQPKPKPMPDFRAGTDRADRAAQRRMVSEGIMRALDLFERDGIDPSDRAAAIIERFHLATAEVRSPGKFSVMRVRRAVEAMIIVFAELGADRDRGTHGAD